MGKSKKSAKIYKKKQEENYSDQQRGYSVFQSQQSQYQKQQQVGVNWEQNCPFEEENKKMEDLQQQQNGDQKSESQSQFQFESVQQSRQSEDSPLFKTPPRKKKAKSSKKQSEKEDLSQNFFQYLVEDFEQGNSPISPISPIQLPLKTKQKVERSLKSTLSRKQYRKYLKQKYRWRTQDDVLIMQLVYNNYLSKGLKIDWSQITKAIDRTKTTTTKDHYEKLMMIIRERIKKNLINIDKVLEGIAQKKQKNTILMDKKINLDKSDVNKQVIHDKKQKDLQFQEKQLKEIKKFWENPTDELIMKFVIKYRSMYVGEWIRKMKTPKYIRQKIINKAEKTEEMIREEEEQRLRHRISLAYRRLQRNKNRKKTTKTRFKWVKKREVEEDDEVIKKLKLKHTPLHKQRKFPQLYILRYSFTDSGQQKSQTKVSHTFKSQKTTKMTKQQLDKYRLLQKLELGLIDQTNPKQVQKEIEIEIDKLIEQVNRGRQQVIDLDSRIRFLKSGYNCDMQYIDYTRKQNDVPGQ